MIEYVLINLVKQFFSHIAPVRWRSLQQRQRQRSTMKTLTRNNIAAWLRFSDKIRCVHRDLTIAYCKTHSTNRHVYTLEFLKFPCSSLISYNYPIIYTHSSSTVSSSEDAANQSCCHGSKSSPSLSSSEAHTPIFKK